jgi:hypothetical protein
VAADHAEDKQNGRQHRHRPESSSLLLGQTRQAFFPSANLPLTASQFTAEKNAFT